MKNYYVLLVCICLALIPGCSDKDFPVPPASTVPKFTMAIDNDAFAPATATFTNGSIIPERAGTVVYNWNFGDGTSSLEANPSHYYNEPGAYHVNLVIVTSGSLEINEVSSTVIIKDPNASGTPFYFTDGGTVYSGLINTLEPVFSPIGITSLSDSYGMAIDTVHDKLYIADYDAGNILVADLDGKNLQTFRSAIGEPDAIAIDYENNQLYFDTSSGIRRADMDNTDASQFEDFVTGQGNDPEGISIDPVNKTIYWNNYDGGVWMKNLDGSGEKEIITGSQGGGSVLVIGDRIYFDDYLGSGDISLKYASLDGSNIGTIATGISKVIYGITYDRSEGKVYWVDRGRSLISRSDLDGGSPETWFSGISARGIVIGKKK